MPGAKIDYAKSPEVMIVALAKAKDQEAFTELVRRRQSWLRNLMRRFCGNNTLADDLAQQVFLQAWRHIHQLKEADKFGAWIRKLAVTTWLQYIRKNDVLRSAVELVDDGGHTAPVITGLVYDLDKALAQLSSNARTCVILSHKEGMTSEEVVEITGMPLGTVKSHIRRGTKALQLLLSDYGNAPQRRIHDA